MVDGRLIIVRLLLPWYRCRARVYAKVLLDIGDTPPLTSTSSPALPRFDTDVRAPPSNDPGCTQRPSRYPSLLPITPPPSSPSTLPFSTTLPTLPTSLNSTPSTLSIAPSPPSLSRASNVGGNPLDDVADAFNVALLDALDALDAAVATLALCVAALIEHRWVRRARRDSSSAARQHTSNELDERSPSSAAWAMSGG
ncbi:hypothetical protein EV121DRAFT_297921 [Schizophyllum commune]